jgi:UDPglucose 6-dehydrogenase
VCTEWKPFWSPDFAHIVEALNYPVIFDGRNLYDPKRLQEQGIQYDAIGRRNYCEAEKVSANSSVSDILENA